MILKPVLLYHQLAILMLSLAFLAQTFSKGFIIADYYSNKIAYARNCINKAKPAMHCNGKCQVMKKMREEEKKEQENAAKSYNSKYEVLSTKSFFASLINPEWINREAVKNAAPCNSLATHRSYDFFHPPQTV